MQKIIEGTEAVIDLQDSLQEEGRVLQRIESWVNYDPNIDLASIDLLKSEMTYYVCVNFGLVSAIWQVTHTERRYLQDSNIIEVAEFMDKLAGEPIIDRS